VNAIAALLAVAAPSEIEAVVGFLTGAPRQGRIGTGWASLRNLEAARADEATLTVGAVDDAITALAGAGGPGSNTARHVMLTRLFTAATVPEADFLVRLLGGELRQGALAGLMADAVARASQTPLESVRRAAMFSGDLGRAARLALTGGSAALDSVALTVLHPVQPMLAAPAADVAAALAVTGPASVEWKLDGARIQVHRDGDDVRIFTRNLNDITARLDGVVAAVRRFPARSLVLDGEAIGLDDTGRPQRFQDTMSRFGADEVGRAAGLQALFFDVLHLDGDDLHDEPLSERLGELDRVAGGLRVPSLVTADPVDAAEFLDAALASGHEGVVVKSMASRYDAGRRGGSWRKVKPVQTLDLVVLAAEWGHGRRRGWLSNLHLGARGSDGTFVMVGKTFKGLTDELLTWQTARLQELALGSDEHTVYVRPELVVEIALDGAQVSRRYAGGVALRFARVRRYRPDKAPAEADTIDAVRALLG
ncbi:MAG: ligase 1, partial [Acidimicrobiaceae bacterium]|nr:ligase 1 [Acidimicrobiaceae bacterium]